MHIPGLEFSLSTQWPTTLSADLYLALLSELPSSPVWVAAGGSALAQTQHFPTRQYKCIRVGSWGWSLKSSLARQETVKYGLIIPILIWTQIAKGRIREPTSDLFRSADTQKRADGGIMILSICKQSVLTFILAVTSLLDRIRALLHVGKGLLFESLNSAWIWLWVSSEKHPSAILVYFSSPKSLIFKNYFSRWIYFTHHVNYLLLFKNQEYAWHWSLCREQQREGLESLLQLTVWD